MKNALSWTRVAVATFTVSLAGAGAMGCGGGPDCSGCPNPETCEEFYDFCRDIGGSRSDCREGAEAPYCGGGFDFDF